jgi:hypothetical protein
MGESTGNAAGVSMQAETTNGHEWTRIRPLSGHGEQSCRERRLSLLSIRVYSCLFVVALLLAHAAAAETWQEALARMPLGAHVGQLNRTNCIDLMLPAFKSNQTVKALIFMPGATDEFYMFKRARAALTMASPTLLDAVSALTNQTEIRATFLPPLLLLHTAEDPLDLLITVKHEATAQKLHQARFVPHALYNDRDWDFVQPILKKHLKVDIKPWRYSSDSWHFYRHSLAAWNLTGWEALEAFGFAGKSGFIVRRKEVDFGCDPRYRTAPILKAFPQD